MNYIIKDTRIVNEGKIIQGDVVIRKGRIESVNNSLEVKYAVKEIDGSDRYLLPGVIDDQVHFREPGLTHKATIYTEAKAAIAGGVTSFMDMPNTMPPAFTQQLLEEKFTIASNSSLANYSFYMGTSNDNLNEVIKTNRKRNEVCGVKVFMGASTGNLLVDSPLALHKLFAESELLIATHCEDEIIIKKNYTKLKEEKEILEAGDHPLIRNEDACFESSLRAVQYAKKYGSRLHILHISTEKELTLFTNMLPLKDKRITSEVCVHHLHFTSTDYERLGNLIKCNPSIKAPGNKTAIWNALLDDTLDVIATDHAPHTLTEKGFYRSENNLLTPLEGVSDGGYEKAHAGLPLVQHSLLLMLNAVKEGKISIEKVAEKMSHAVAICFQIKERGFIREGYFADLVLVDMNKPCGVNHKNLLFKCDWSPLEGFTFPATVTHTFVNGNLIYENNVFYESNKGMRLKFER